MMNRRLLLWAVKYVEPTPRRHVLARKRMGLLNELATHAESRYSLDDLFRLQCIFFHLPKTGGLAVSDALFGNQAAGHINVNTAKVLFGARRFRLFFKFCFVRNPWDRLVSAYHYLRQGHPNSPVVEILQRSDGFADFVMHMLREKVVARELHIRPLHSFVVDRNGRLAVDFVGRFEHLARDCDVVARRLGVSCSLRVQNRSPHEDYRTYYDDQTRRIVEEFYRRDIELFEYHFNE